EEVLPAQHHRHVERAARVEHRLDGQALAAGRLATADLRAEALRHHGVVALGGAGRDQRLARADDAVAARSGHSDHQVSRHRFLWWSFLAGFGPGGKRTAGGRRGAALAVRGGPRAIRAAAGPRPGIATPFLLESPSKRGRDTIVRREAFSDTTFLWEVLAP